ncbi:ApeA N-terminal domain 1-containing protein [Flavobacterium stagni]|uniref:ApeA N-terminal domain-containing protein n=1 Tax=Flavobacterium stagni TaxID=2506421 RepID=A0A4Q1KFV9_9FLAO|nr:hypothetical protein [Flavobacterium stagni]RXR24678.1 hypothetical protein EQG61_04320 [Flavobacterium stagni]
MFKKDKYYGEIWLPNKEGQKQFCTIEVVENDFFLNTILLTDLLQIKLDIIYGVFNDLGCLTFVNCNIIRSETGVVKYKKICPDYVFACANHFIEPKGIRLKSIEIENNTINDFISNFHTMNPLKDKVEVQNVQINKININEDLTLSLFKNYGIETNRFGTNILNHGILKFEFNYEKSLLQSIEIYRHFQKFCIMFFFGIEKFNYFKSNCLNCGEEYYIVFNDDLAFTHNQGIFHKFSFKNFDSFPSVISNWYNNEDLKYCFDIIIENYLSKKVSRARRFTNSISSFEAFYKLFSVESKHKKLNKRIFEYKDIFCLMDPNIVEIEEFSRKMIRIRDFYVHGNRDQKTEHSSFELLYYSLLLDFVVIRELSTVLGFADNDIKKIENAGISVFKNQLPLNRLINENLIID